MAMKVCKDCGTEVSKSAKTCPKCGRKLKHTGLRVILGIIIIFIALIAIASNGNNTNQETSSTNTSTNQSIVTKENYNKIEEGMTESEVENILGTPTSTSESETPGVGTMILKHYQEPLTLKAIDVYFLDGKVYMKNWTEL